MEIRTKTYKFEFGFFNIGDMFALNALLIKMADPETSRPIMANEFIAFVRRFALFDIDNEPMDNISLTIDDFAKAYKERYEGIRD